MTRPLYVAWVSALAFCLVFTPVAGIAAIWLQWARLGYTCAVTGFVALVAGISMSFWVIENEPPQRLPSRRVRKQLRAERDRIAFESRIAQMEREAGIR